MRALFSLVASPVLVVGLLASPGCGGGPTLDASFSAATTDQRTTAVLAARGDVTGLALFTSLGIVTSAAPGSTCPVVTFSGADATVKGGCSSGAVRYEGSFTIKNYTLINPPEGTTPGDGTARFEWDSFTGTGSSKVVLDGSVEIEVKGTTSRLSADHSVEIAGERVDVEVTRSCTLGQCTRSDGATVSVSGVGSAEIAGDFVQRGATWSGALELHGADVLRVDFATTTTAGCYQTTAGGAAVDAVCPDASDAPLRALRQAMTPR